MDKFRYPETESLAGAGEEGSSTLTDIVEISRVKINRVTDKSKTATFDAVIHEIEVTIEINGTRTRLYCLPTYLDELAIGHSLSEGINPDGIEIKEGMIKISGAKPVDNEPKTITSQYKVKAEEITRYADKLDENGLLFRKTGGTHVVGIFGEGNPIFMEDISRHCAIDKVLGLAIKNNLDLHQSTLVTSCRQTISTIRKAIRAQIPVVVSISAPTDLAIKEAKDFGITLIGFCRNHKFNIYSHDWRVT